MSIPTTNEQTKLTNKLMENIKDLLNAYSVDMGISLVSTKEVDVDRTVLGLRELVSVVNTTIDMEQFPSGLSTRSRKREIVMKRQIVSYIARKLGYPLNLVGRSMVIDHATVIHGCNTVTALLFNKDVEMTAAYADILKLVTVYYKDKYGKDLSQTFK